MRILRRKRQLLEYIRFLEHRAYSFCHFTTKGNRRLEKLSPRLDTANLRMAVYTCIVGHYDSLIEPRIAEPGIDYYVFTDIDIPAGSVWKKIDITQFDEYHEFSPTQLNRRIKMLPFCYLPDYDYSVYVDGNIEIEGAVTPVVAEMGDCPFGTHYHRTRDCIYVEKVRVNYLRKADKETVDKQTAAYREAGFPRHYGLYENSILIRSHRDESVRHLMEAWWEEYMRYPTRDQLSLPYLIWKTGYDKSSIHIIGTNIDRNPNFRRTHSHITAKPS